MFHRLQSRIVYSVAPKNWKLGLLEVWEIWDDMLRLRYPTHSPDSFKEFFKLQKDLAHYLTQLRKQLIKNKQQMAKKSSS